VAEKDISRAPPPTSSALYTAPTAREVGVAGPFHFPIRDPRARATGISCFPRQTNAKSYLRFSASSLFLIFRMLPVSKSGRSGET
jgi:hypothetical protein